MSMISLVIPYKEVDAWKPQVLGKCVSSMASEVDEIIIMRKDYDNLAQKINDGVKQTRGDWIIVCNDDIELSVGSIEQLLVPGVVTVPKVIGGLDKLFHGHFWVMDRQTLNTVGPIFEGYKGFYYDDSDYWMTIESKGIETRKVREVTILHREPGRTLSKLHDPDRERHNREIFIERWGAEAYKKIR